MGSFDFVVVGSGSAGSVVANRLTENGRHTVLLLEAGGTDMHFYIQMPLGFGKTFFDHRVNWSYHAEPDPGLAGNRDHWPRGKILGGSSSVNSMVWIRGNRQDFEDWREEGNPGWGYADMLTAFKAIEHAEIGGDEWRGRSGPLYVSDQTPLVHPLTHAFVKAGKEAGLSVNPDFNGADQDGIGVYEITTKDGLRMSAARAFLRPAMKRANLKIEMKAHARRILFEGKRAVGVEYLRNGQTERAIANREVILCAGSVNSPQLLQLSGVGPATPLTQLGIPVVHDNPNVGANLQDHLAIKYTYRSRVPTLNQILRPFIGKLKVGAKYLLSRSGPLAASINQGGGFVRTSPDRRQPNIQLYFQPFSTVIPRPGERPFLSPDPFPAFSLSVSNCRPTSRGRITIRSSDPHAAPKIEPNAYSTNSDIAEMLEGVKFLRKLAATDALAPLIVEEILPGPQCVTDDDMVDDLHRRSASVYHPCSTCRMGPDQTRAVVDARLRVHGVQGLRIVDASIFPTVLSGNLNAGAVATGWKGSGMILEDMH
ncbi:GMC family oxidoreductase [Pseudochelatococcus sp. B33]